MKKTKSIEEAEAGRQTATFDWRPASYYYTVKLSIQTQFYWLAIYYIEVWVVMVNYRFGPVHFHQVWHRGQFNQRARLLMPVIM